VKKGVVVGEEEGGGEWVTSPPPSTADFRATVEINDDIFVGLLFLYLLHDVK